MNPPLAAIASITFAMMRQAMTSAVVCDALDAEGFPH